MRLEGTLLGVSTLLARFATFGWLQPTLAVGKRPITKSSTQGDHAVQVTGLFSSTAPPSHELLASFGGNPGSGANLSGSLGNRSPLVMTFRCARRARVRFGDRLLRRWILGVL